MTERGHQRIDWSRFQQHPLVAATAAAISERWGVWVGLASRAGQVFPLAPRQHDDSRHLGPAICQLFMKRRDGSGACSTSLLSWAGATDAERFVCHAELEAQVVPITALGHPTGAVAYASGFVQANAEGDRTAAVIDRANGLAIDPKASTRALDSLSRLDEADRRAIDCLLQVMREAIERELATERGDSPDPPRTAPHDYSHIVGRSPSILRLFSLLDRVVESDSTVLIQGENGTGKELFARAVHANSKRRALAFVTQNCSALNDNLLDSELFGHRRGSFTGAIADKRGLFEVADGGTLLLDEIGDMSPMMQVKLLRVLQEGTFAPVGDTVVRRVDVRIIAASNRDLRSLVAEGSFREDLFYRLNVICLDVPPLRERREDIPLLADHFLREFAHRSGGPPMRLSDPTRALFLAYDWPGNVRELRHEIERLVVLGGPAEVVPHHLVSERITMAADPRPHDPGPDEHASLPEAIEALERRMIRSALEETNWNKTHAAKRLGVSRRNLIRKVQAFGLEPG